MTTTINVCASSHRVQVIGHDNTGLNVSETYVEKGETRTFYAHSHLSFTVSEVDENGNTAKPDTPLPEGF